MCDYRNILKSEESNNWFKCCLAVRCIRDVLAHVVKENIEDLQGHILEDIIRKGNLPDGTTCTRCGTTNLLKCPTKDVCLVKKGKCNFHDGPKNSQRPCPNLLCDQLAEHIIQEHRFRSPSWKNTDASGWCVRPWEIAKCYLPPDGYSDVKTADESDLNGLISIFINCKYLQKRFKDDLSKSTNLCTKVRVVAREIRHSPDLKITDQNAAEYIDILLALLDDPQYMQTDSKAKEARETLHKIKCDSLTITTQDIAAVLGEAAKSIEESKNDAQLNIQQELQNSLAQLNDHGREVKQNISDEASLNVKSETKIAQECLKKDIDDGKETLRIATGRVKGDIDDFGNKIIHEAREEIMSVVGKQLGVIQHHSNDQADAVYSPTTYNYRELKDDLQKDLIVHYKDRCSTMPLSPLMEEIDDDLKKFYVSPRITKIFPIVTKVASGHNVTDVGGYRDLLYNDNKRARNIYIEGEPGTGKSSFCAHMALEWSDRKANSDAKTAVFYKLTKLVQGKRKCSSSDDKALTEFDFLFYISLGEARGSDCEIEEMIRIQIINELGRRKKWTKQLIQDVLKTENCLILLDGLDEWTHPGTEHRSCDRKKLSIRTGIPHRNTCKFATFITTTRPWKMNEISIKDSDIDTRLEILGAKDPQLLIDKVIDCLNKKRNADKCKEQFNKHIHENTLNNLIAVPLLLMQLICLWYDGRSFGETKCEIYSNMVEMLMSRKNVNTGIERTSIPKAQRETCFEEQKDIHSSTKIGASHGHISLLESLSKLAFYTLYSTYRELSLVFDKSVVEMYLTPDEINMALSIGLLSQHKTPATLTKVQSTFCFLHKTFQEYLAANYLSKNREKVETLKKACRNSTGVFELEEFLAFLFGMKPELAADIIKMAMGVTIKQICLNCPTKIQETIARLQKLTADLVKKSAPNEHPPIKICQQHILWNKDQPYVARPFVNADVDGLLSCCIENNTISIESVQQLIKPSCQTLTILILYNVTSTCTTSATNLDLSACRSLECLCIRRVGSFDIKQLDARSLIQLELADVSLFSELNVLAALNAVAPKLQILTISSLKHNDLFCEILPSLLSLRQLYIGYAQIHVPSGSFDIPSSIESIQLSNVNLGADSLKNVVDTMINVRHSVKFELTDSKVTPEEKFNGLKHFIETSNIFKGDELWMYEVTQRLKFQTIVPTVPVHNSWH